MKFLLERISFLMHIQVVATLLVGMLALGVDSFLIAAVLILFAVGLHTLFLGKLDLPEVFQAQSLHDLESKIASLIVLVMALFTLERFMESPTDPSNLPMAGAFAVVTVGIIGFIVHKGLLRGRRPSRGRLGKPFR